MKKQVRLLADRGYIFGLGAFRRYKEITGGDISHFEESLFGKVDQIDSNYRWAVMLKCANDTHIAINGGESISIDAFEVLLSEADQSESNELLNQYLNSNYMGKPMRDYYGIPKPEETAKKKPSVRAKPTSRR